ncbi:MAG: helix-turn-helix transcriptional regulator [Bacilli bacterium]|jgi:transcriptional regulator with XRE-family HTH domain
MINQIEIGRYIAKLRRGQGVTQKELADQLGLSFQAVSKWETGETLPDTGILLELADILGTTTDKILSGGNLVLRKGKSVRVENIKEGIDALINLRHLLGEKNTFYQGAIEGINKRMNIDFEKLAKDATQREYLIGEVIIQYLMDGYAIDGDDVMTYIKDKKLLNIIAKYMGEKAYFDTLTYNNNKALFDQIRAIKPEFAKLSELTRLPGEYIRLEAKKDYWCSQIEVDANFCYGIAVDEKTIKITTYGFGGENQQLVHEEKRKD